MNYVVPFHPGSGAVRPFPYDAADDQKRTAILWNFRPSYYTAAGLAVAVLHKMTRLHNGKVGALYDVKIVNPTTGKQESTRYVYGVNEHANWTPKELKKLSTLVR